MATHHPVTWVKSRAATGLKDLPSNAAWVAGRMRRTPAKGLSGASDAATGVGSALSHARRSVAEHMPFVGNGTAVDALVGSARSTAEEAREAESRALALAQEARQAAEEAKRASEAAFEQARQTEAESRAVASERIDKVKTETSAQVAKVKSDADERVQAARHDADERVAEERRQAKQEADAAIARAKDAAANSARAAQQAAEEASDRAQEAVARATDAVARARETADRAAQAALAAAATAGREAERLAAEAGEVRSQVAEYEQATNGSGQASTTSVRTAPPVPARRARRSPRRAAPSTAQSKADLVRQAAALGIEGRTTMSKVQLVNAIKKAPAGRR